MSVPEQYDLAADPALPCPVCGTALPPGVVVCVKCGFNLQANEKIATETSVQVVEPPPPGPRPISGLGKPGLSPLISTFAAIVVVAMALTITGAWKTDSGGRIAAKVAQVVYFSLLHTATGLLAIALTAQWISRPVGRWDLAVGRIAVAVAASLVVTSAPWPEFTMSAVVAALCGGCAYLGVVMALFRATPPVAAKLGVIHLGLVVLLSIGTTLGGWLSASANPDANAPGARSTR